MEKASHVIASDNLNDAKRQSTASRSGLIRRLRKGKEGRAKFVDSHISKGIAFQIQGLRDRDGLTQQQLAERLGSNQNSVYRLENPNYGKPTITTLKKVAAAFDVALVVRFVPFSQLVNWISGTPYVDRGLSTEALEVPGFNSELSTGVFDESGMPTQASVLSQAPQRVAWDSMAEALAAVYAHTQQQETAARKFVAAQTQAMEAVHYWSTETTLKYERQLEALADLVKTQLSPQGSVAGQPSVAVPGNRVVPINVGTKLVVQQPPLNRQEEPAA